jgi:hypothetical protein
MTFAVGLAAEIAVLGLLSYWLDRPARARRARAACDIRARAAAHRARLATQPVPYQLTPAAEQLLTSRAYRDRDDLTAIADVVAQPRPRSRPRHARTGRARCGCWWEYTSPAEAEAVVHPCLRHSYMRNHEFAVWAAEMGNQP